MSDLKYYIKLAENHQFVVTIITSVIASVVTGILYNFLLYKWAQISINKEAEKIKHEMQRRYLYIEIKTKNLLEIYPKLYRLLREAGSLIVIFDVINKKIKELPSEKQNQQTETIKLLIKAGFDQFNEDNPLGLRNIVSFANCYEESLLFISEEIDTLAKQSKDLLMDLYRLAKDEIASNAFQQYSQDQLIDLIKRANIIIEKLTINKNNIAKQMKKEFDPFQNKVID